MTVLKKKNPSEAWEQRHIFDWWHRKSSEVPVFESSLMHIPNGTLQASRMKQRGLGVRSGVPDLLLCLPRGRYHGLWIELKRVKGGVVSPEQVEFTQHLKSMSYAAFVCRGHDSAERLISQYILDPDSLDPLVGKLVYE